MSIGDKVMGTARQEWCVAMVVMTENPKLQLVIVEGSDAFCTQVH